MGLEPTTPGITIQYSTFELQPPYGKRTPSLARPAGLEPTTPGLEGRCSIRLSYGHSNGGYQTAKFGRGGEI